MENIRIAWLCLVWGASGCLAVDVGNSDGGGGRPKSVCQLDDANPLGPACRQNVESEAQFKALSRELGGAGTPYERATKFTLPASDDPSLLPPVVQNSRRYELHLLFLGQVFPDYFPGLTVAGYKQLILTRASRRYYAGALIQLNHPQVGRVLGFTVWAGEGEPAEALEMIEVEEVYRKVRALVPFSPVAYTFDPTDHVAMAKASSWVNPSFPVVFPAGGAPVSEVYTEGVSYGRLRLFHLAELNDAARQGLIGYRDLVVVDAVPFDLETVVAGLVTGGRQWELSHVNVRLSRRGTINLYYQDPLKQFSDLDGAWVRLEAKKRLSGDFVFWEEVSQAEVDAYWAEHRPKLPNLPVFDPAFREIQNVLDMDVDDTPVPLVRRFGGKASNLAKLNAILPTENAVRALAVPFAFYEGFMASEKILDRRVKPAEEISLREYVRRLANDPTLDGDVVTRRQLLWDLRARIESATPDRELIRFLGERIRQVFGGATTKLKVRSSSNIEDALEFSAAGLYTSVAACLADDEDGDRDGPSACDPGQSEEHGLAQALTQVWASLYNARAWEERGWYQIPQNSASMALLINEATSGEQANGVAFTGNPEQPGDSRYLINAQYGEEPVVGTDPSLLPEADLLTLKDGQVTRIERARTSVLMDKPLAYVLPESTLKELGSLMNFVAGRFPLETGGHDPNLVLLDMEFKWMPDGRLRLKQIRPFLKRAAP